MTLKKKLLVGAALAVSLLAIGAVVLRLAVNPEVFKPQIEQLVEQTTGLSLHMEGPIRLSYFPWLGIELGRASLGGLKGFEQDPFLQVERADIKVRLASLLRGDLEAGAIKLDGLSVTLIKAKDGRTNWQALPIREVTLEKNQVVVRSDSGQTAFNYLLEGFSLVGGALIYEDRALGTMVRVTDVNAKTGRVATGKTSDVALSLKLVMDQPQVSVATALTGKLTVDPGDLVFSFDQADLDLKADAPSLPFHQLTGTGKADVTVHGQDARVLVRNIALSATAAGGMFPAKGETAKLAGTFDFNANAGALSFSDLELSGLGLTAKGRIDGDLGKPGVEPRFVWKFSTNAFNPKTLLASLGISLSGLPDGALSSLETQGEAVFSPSALGLTVKPLRLDGQNLSFTAEVTDFNKPAMRFNLTADALDADRYLSVKTPAKEAAKSPSKGGGAGDAALKTARIDGEINLGRLTVKGLALTNVHVKVAAADGTVTVKPFSCGLSGGAVAGGLTVALARPVPAWNLNATVSGVAVKPVLAAVAGTSALSGVLSVKTDIATKGNTPEALMASLSGPVSLRLDNGVVEGFSVSPQLLASLKGVVSLVELNPVALVQAAGNVSQALAASHQGSTQITQAGASFHFNSGVGSTKDILVRSSLGQVTGAGSVDLGREQLNLALRADVTGVGVVPLLVDGSFKSPNVTVDKEALAKQALTAVPRALGNTLKQSGKNVLDTVKGIFGQ
jgi:AsmA protein